VRASIASEREREERRGVLRPRVSAPRSQGGEGVHAPGPRRKWAGEKNWAVRGGGGGGGRSGGGGGGVGDGSCPLFFFFFFFIFFTIDSY